MRYTSDNLFGKANELLRQFDENKDPVKLEDAVELYKMSLREDPNFTYSYIGLANSELRRFKFEVDKIGLDTYEKLANAPKNIRKHLDRAIESANKAIKLESNNANAHLALGRCFDYSNNLEGAISEMEIAVQLYPEFLTAHHDLGLVYLRRGDANKAREHLQKAVASEYQSISSSAQKMLEEISKVYK